MDWIDLGNPHPRLEPGVYEPLAWPEGNVVRPVGAPSSGIDRSSSDVARHRRSCREFAPVPPEAMLATLGEVLSMACGAQAVGTDSLGFPLSRRPAPSAGAIHPIHLVVTAPPQNEWYRFDPLTRLLIGLPTTVRAAEVRATFDEVLPAAHAALVLFVAEPGMTATKYENSASLVWRDAGVLQGIVSLAAEALGLGCTLLGITGDPWSAQLLDQPGLHGVGAAFVGRPAAHTPY
jgi:hypothetical protein